MGIAVLADGGAMAVERGALRRRDTLAGRRWSGPRGDETGRSHAAVGCCHHCPSIDTQPLLSPACHCHCQPLPALLSRHTSHHISPHPSPL